MLDTGTKHRQEVLRIFRDYIRGSLPEEALPHLYDLALDEVLFENWKIGYRIFQIAPLDILKEDEDNLFYAPTIMGKAEYEKLSVANGLLPWFESYEVEKVREGDEWDEIPFTHFDKYTTPVDPNEVQRFLDYEHLWLRLDVIITVDFRPLLSDEMNDENQQVAAKIKDAIRKVIFKGPVYKEYPKP